MNVIKDQFQPAVLINVAKPCFDPKKTASVLEEVPILETCWLNNCPTKSMGCLNCHIKPPVSYLEKKLKYIIPSKNVGVPYIFFSFRSGSINSISVI